jgi:hypothetical protein
MMNKNDIITDFYKAVYKEVIKDRSKEKEVIKDRSK